MRIFSFITLVSILFFIANPFLAQDKILLLNGKSYEGKFLSKSEDLVNFNFKKKIGKNKTF